MKTDLPIVLTIAGSDPSAGAGIQQDLKTMTAMHCYGATVITTLTSQNTMGVRDVMPVPPEVVTSQLEAVLEDLDVRAIKIGQIPTADIAQAIAQTIRHFELHIPVIYDPVMISTSGRRLMREDAVDVVTGEIFPLCTLITPNIPEVIHLLGRELNSDDDLLQAGKELVSIYSTDFLLKGGHATGDNMTDRLFQRDGSIKVYESPRIITRNLHGTGCTLSSAIASSMAHGNDIQAAVGEAKKYITQAICGGRDLHIGHGNGPLWY